MKLYGLIGYPLSHSFSKKYFTEKFERESISYCRFENFEIEHIDLLETMVLKPHPELSGFAVTIPHKKEVIKLLHNKSKLSLGACNCVKISDGKLIGYNTDVIGLEQSLLQFLKAHHTPALVLGTGGAAEAAYYVLSKLNIPHTKVSRSGNAGTVGYLDVDAALVAKHKLIINCTPLGTFPKVDEKPPIAYQGIGADHYLFDLVYNPPETAFLMEGKIRGATIKNGADMFEIQAEANWKIWNDDNL
jgi:shikimate dehydrogenase